MAVYKPTYCYPYLEAVDLVIPDGEKYFRNKETEMIEKLSKMDNIIISTGGGVIKNKRNIEIAKSGGFKPADH